jgi:hypothetical protein
MVQKNVCLVGPKDSNVQCVAVSAKHLHQFELQGNTFLEHGVTCDETWVPCFTRESKWSSVGWHHKGSRPLNRFKTQLSAGKIMASMFGIEKVWFMSIFFNMVQQLMHDVTVLRFTMMSTRWLAIQDLERCQRSSYCMTMLTYLWKISWRWHWQQWARKSWATLLIALT